MGPGRLTMRYSSGNSPRWLASHLGIVASGNTVVPLDTAFHADQVTKLLLDCGATFLFVDERFRELGERATADMSVRLVMIEGDDAQLPNLNAMFQAGPGDFIPESSQLDDVACILYTSGTTSDPKGVMLTHDNLRGEMDAVFSFIRIDETDALLGVLPLFHALAQMANLLLPLAIGAKVVFLESLNTTELMRALRERDITIFCCVPQFFYLIHEKIFQEAQARGAVTTRLLKVLLGLNRITRRFHVNVGKVFLR